MLEEMKRRLTVRTLAMQIAGNAVLALVFAGWLQIPDSHAWQFAISILVAVVLVAALLALHAGTVRAMRDAATPMALWLSCLILAGWLLVWHLLVHGTLRIEPHFPEWSGYWNSQFPAHMRTFFSYERIYGWLEYSLTTLLWWILPCLLLPLIVSTVTRGVKGPAWITALRVYMRWQLWVGMGAAAWLALWPTGKLLDWHPLHTVRGEVVSLTLRFPLVYLVDVLLYCLVLALVTVLLARQSTGGHAIAEPVANTPEAETGY